MEGKKGSRVVETTPDPFLCFPLFVLFPTVQAIEELAAENYAHALNDPRDDRIRRTMTNAIIDQAKKRTSRRAPPRRIVTLPTDR